MPLNFVAVVGHQIVKNEDGGAAAGECDGEAVFGGDQLTEPIGKGAGQFSYGGESVVCSECHCLDLG